MKFQRNAYTNVFHHILSFQQNICKFQSISPEDAHEEENILQSIAWPTTPSITSNLNVKNTSDPSCSMYTILPKVGGGHWYIGDQLEVSIIIKDYNCHPKTSGGDFLVASLKNKDLQAGVSGHVVDHLNGSYTAVFTLVWEGQAQVEVILVHPSEAVTVLQRQNKKHFDRVYFKGTFRSGSVTETTVCNVCLRPTAQPVCNYTDARTGEPWFCLKPKNLSCDTRIEHSRGGYSHSIGTQEYNLFKHNLNMNVPIWSSGSSIITVHQKSQLKNTSVKFKPSGFYIKGVWQSHGNYKFHQFDNASIVQCLKGKVIHMYGDSTIRQWFGYLNNAMPDLKEFNLHASEKTSPFMSLDYKNNILVTFRCHGPPIRIRTIPISELRYIANELDTIRGGSNTVVALSVWAHFGNFPIQIYIRRLMSIRSAVMRLLTRAPETLVVIRSGNLQCAAFPVTLTNSDWYSLQCDKALRAVFKDMNVRLVDAWEMVLAHHLPPQLHPQPPIIKNMVDVLLSYTCPQKRE
ncbi:NXPE family member 3-like [Gouania willdenowi]|uniref:NXPE family member 3-like n=1 Tax=Gouania willdenowi TaxID=441366 RepID=UPI0010569FE7|nr:NXPE family member 3-like [Gouania willdenowi]